MFKFILYLWRISYLRQILQVHCNLCSEVSSSKPLKDSQHPRRQISPALFKQRYTVRVLIRMAEGHVRPCNSLLLFYFMSHYNPIN